MIRHCYPTDGSGLAVALRAFCDASEQGGIFSVAGVAFGPSRAAKAQNKWRRLHGSRVLHMTDLHGRFGDFAGMSSEAAGCLLKGSVAIMSDYMQFAVAASCDINECRGQFNIQQTGDNLIDTIMKGFSSPYAWCCHTVMHHIGKLTARSSGRQNSVTYLFETGDNGQGRVKEFVRFVEDHDAPILRNAYCMNGAQFAQKDGKEVLLQSADILSWEWARHINRKRDGRKIRPSLDAIFGGLDEMQSKYGFTAASTKPGKAIGSHYQGDSWQAGYSRLVEHLTKQHEQNAIVSLYRNWPDLPEGWS